MLLRLLSNAAATHVGLMLTLTFSTGLIDAVGYLGLDRVFTANMTGNVVILGMALTGADGLPVAGPAIALLGFTLGAALAGRVLRSATDGWTTRITMLLVPVAALIFASAAVVLICPDPRIAAVALPVTAAISIAMGAQAGAARHIAVQDVSTVVVTSTLVGLAFDSRWGRGAGQKWTRRFLALICIGAGAAVGALLLQISLGAGMIAAALVILVVAVLGHLGRPLAGVPAQIQTAGVA